ncbi:MAG: cyclase family protein [Tissierellales bacterium]|nr:cyclase family protein [Tissierellales bacterium]MBN2826911.1 cyclase family protein [Tissierellales bacterium]
MRVIDLSQKLEQGMAVYPGAPEPTFEQWQSVADGDIYQLIKFSMTTHTGTHLDCNTHVHKDGYSTDTQDVGFFIGKGRVLDCTKYANNEVMGMEIFDGIDLDGVNFIFLYCGWDKKWGQPEFWSDYPYISMEVAEFIRDHHTVRGIGMEYACLDPNNQPELDLHKVVLSKEKTVIENLANLDLINGKDFLFVGLPLKFKDGEGSPIKAVAIIEE